MSALTSGAGSPFRPSRSRRRVSLGDRTPGRARSTAARRTPPRTSPISLTSDRSCSASAIGGRPLRSASAAATRSSRGQSRPHCLHARTGCSTGRSSRPAENAGARACRRWPTTPCVRGSLAGRCAETWIRGTYGHSGVHTPRRASAVSWLKNCQGIRRGAYTRHCWIRDEVGAVVDDRMPWNGESKSAARNRARVTPSSPAAPTEKCSGSWSGRGRGRGIPQLLASASPIRGCPQATAREAGPMPRPCPNFGCLEGPQATKSGTWLNTNGDMVRARRSTTPRPAHGRRGRRTSSRLSRTARRPPRSDTAGRC